MATILDGNALAKRVRDKVAERVQSLPTQPGLAVILVGDDPASHTYVSLKQKACEEVGIRSERIDFPADVPVETIIETVRSLNAREDIHGILVQLPLPSQDADLVIPEIDPDKDVDGFHQESLRRLRAGEPTIVSPVGLGVMKLIGEVPKETYAVIVASERFAEPLKLLMKEQGMVVDVIQAEVPALATITREADVLVVAEGIPGLITAAHVKPGAIVIDVGTTKVDEQLKGDVAFEEVEPLAGSITPVPGGVGPMTVAMLMLNVLNAYRLTQSGKR